MNRIALYKSFVQTLQLETDYKKGGWSLSKKRREKCYFKGKCSFRDKAGNCNWKYQCSQKGENFLRIKRMLSWKSAIEETSEG